MRKIYSLLTCLLAPFIPLYLIKRGLKNPDYLTNWQERFGLLLNNPADKPLIWLHSVSVGETRAMLKIVDILKQNYPSYQLLITTMTPTGRATAQNLYPQAIVHYVPYDISLCVNSFLNTFKPKICIIMETEIWPNLIHFTHKKHIPIFLVNARLSDKSYLGYKRFSWALKPILNSIQSILCQDGATRLNFTKLDYQGKLLVTGNTKFDLEINHQTYTTISLFKKTFTNRKVITFSSTRQGEEEQIIANLDFGLDVLYLIIPRHPERFSVVAKLLEDANIVYQRRSTMSKLLPATQVVIGDSMGEMLAYYAISYLAVIGGSFADLGGQSPIEALFMGVPVVFGPSMYNFRAVSISALENKCAIQVANLASLHNTINDVVNNSLYYNHLKYNCNDFIKKNNGASQKVVKHIEEYL